MQRGAGSTRFPRALRLTQSAQFQRVFTRAIKSSDDCFTVLARSNQLPAARLGLAIARKHVKLAVARNRIKRVVRESFRLHQTSLSGLDLVVLARAGLADKTTTQMHTSLERHWARLVQRCASSSSP